MRLPQNCLVLVVDGRKMLLFRNQGTATEPDLTVEYGEEQPNPADQDQKSDARGQRPATGSPGQASTGEVDYHQQTEDEFARHVAEHINAMALQNALDPIVIVAAGKVLGQLRRHYHKETAARIIVEIDKVMTGYSTDRIAKMLIDQDEVV